MAKFTRFIISRIETAVVLIQQVYIYLAQVTLGVTDTYHSHRIAKIVVNDNNIGQFITQDSSLKLLFMINRRLIFLLRQKWKNCTCLLLLQLEDGLSASLYEIIQILRWAFHVFYC